MSFGTEIATIMIADTSINNEISTNNICYENLPDNFDLKQKWLLYNYRQNEIVSCMSGTKAYTNYELMTYVLTQNTTDLETISDRLVEYLNNKSSGNIIDIQFVNDAHAFDQEKNIYSNTLTFNCIYT